MVKLRRCSDESAAETSTDVLKINGASKTLYVNANCSDKMPTKESSFPNGNCNNVPAKVNLSVNENCSNEVSVNEASAVNGHSDTMSAINGNRVLVSDIPTVNGNCVDEAQEVPMVNGKCNDKNSSNGSNALSESDSCSNVHISDSLCNGDNSNENQQGFIEVVNKKKRNKNRNKNRRKKPISNLPPGLNTESIRRDNVNDKNCGEKSSPTHISLKQPRKNFAAIRSSEKSYSSALVNGQNGNSLLRNGGPNISSDSQNVTKCTEAKKHLNNTNLPGTCISVDQLSTDLTKSVIDETSAVSCKQSNLSTKVEMTDVSAQTDVCSENETSPSQKECLLSHEEVIHESEKASSPSDYGVDVGEISDESSNAAYCDSVDIKQGDGESSNVENHGELGDAEESNLKYYNEGQVGDAGEYDVVEYCNDEFGEAGEYNIEYYNDEFGEAGEYNIEYYNDEYYGAEDYNEWNGAVYGGSLFADRSWMGNIEFHDGCPVYLFPCRGFVSNDSGRGDSEITYDGSMPYCCEFPERLTSQLIGKLGSFRYEIERKSGIKLWVYPHLYDKDLSIICMTGTGAQIEKAKELIKERFRHVTLRQWLGYNPINPPLSEKYLPVLPESTDFMGIVSCICDPTFFWMQQYGHPKFYALEDLERNMTDHFNTVTDAPGIDNPTIGSVIAVPGVRDGDNVKWIRGWIINVIPEEETVVVRYLDHGGDRQVPVSNIRAMRHDFFSLPFYASQCCLYDILPAGTGWSDEALAEFKRLCSGSTPPVVTVKGKTPDCYFVSMVVYDSETNASVDIASYLVSKGFGVRPPIPATQF